MASGLPAQTIPSMSIFRGRLARDHDLVGCFDEESCRYFLREVGSKVVPFYPFTFGMEEVYSLIIEEYGLAGIPDATSVLQDLLENERTAGGLGDDGDIWRSWRHSWRHRNDDSLNPFIPKISSFVLKPPTSPRTRISKSENFLRTFDQQWRRDETVNLMSATSDKTTTLQSQVDAGEGPSEYSSKPAALTFTHQRLRTAFETTEGSHSYASRKHESTGTTKAWSRSTSFRSSLFGRQSSTPLRAKESPNSYPKQSSNLAAPCQPDLDMNISPSLPTFVPIIQFSSPRLPLVPQAERVRPNIHTSESHDSYHTVQGSQPDGAMSLVDSDIDPSVLLAFEMLTGEESSSAEQKPYLRGGGGVEVAPSNQVNKTTTQCSATPPPAFLSLPGCNITTGLCRTDNTISDYSQTGFPSVTDQPQEEISDASPRSKTAVTSSPALSSALNFPTITRDLFEEIPGANVLRAINREARLIDGQFCNPRVWKRLSSQPLELHDRGSMQVDDKPSSIHLSWTSSKPKRESRSSLFRGVRGVFRKETLLDQLPLSVKMEGDDQLQSINTPILPVRVNRVPPSGVKKQRPGYALAIDGAADEMPSPSRSLSPDVNKALPLSPGELARVLSDRRHLRRASTASHDHPTPSPLVSGLHRSSSNRESGDRSRYTLSHQRLSARCFSPFGRRGPRHVRTRTEPINSSPVPFSPLSYSTIAYSNPFTSDKIALSPVRHPSPLFARIGPHKTSPEPAATSARRPDLEHSPASNSTCTMYDYSPGPNPAKPSVSARRPDLEHSPVYNSACTTYGYSPGPSLEKPSVPNTPKRAIKAFFGRSKSPSKRSASPTSRVIQPIFMISDQEKTTKDPQHDTPANVTPLHQNDLFTFRLDERSIAAAPQNKAISLDPPSQSVLQADLDLMLVTSANLFLLHEAAAQRLAPEVVKVEQQKWAARGFFPVIDFQYDSTTQCSIVSTNIMSLRFHGIARENNLLSLKAAITAWLNVTQFLSQRVYCQPDVLIRNILHDGSKVLDLLGAPEKTVLAFYDMQIKALAQMNRVRRLRG